MIHYLSQHPRIYVSPVKEPHFFNEDSGHRFYFSMKDYLNLFTENDSFDYRAEGSVWYLYSKVAIENILKFNSRARFVVMLRDPVSMYFSLHQELLYGGNEDEHSALVAWELQDERRKGNKIPLGCSDPRFLQYGKACSLGEQLNFAMKKIPSQQIHYVFLEDIKKDPDSEFKKVLDFLRHIPF